MIHALVLVGVILNCVMMELFTLPVHWPSGLFFATIMITGYHWILCWRICHLLATTWTGFVAIAISVSYFIIIQKSPVWKSCIGARWRNIKLCNDGFVYAPCASPIRPVLCHNHDHWLPLNPLLKDLPSIGNYLDRFCGDSCAKFLQSGTHYLHQPFELWCMHSSVHGLTSPTASSTGRVRIFSIVFSRSWILQRAWFWKSGNTIRSQPLFDGISIGYRSKLVYNSSWTSLQEIASWVKPQHIWPSSATLSTRSRRGATYDRQCRCSFWSHVSVRSALVVVVSPSHHCNCGTYFQLTFDSYTKSHSFSERDWKLISCSSPFFTTEDLCHQCDIYYYYYLFYNYSQQRIDIKCMGRSSNKHCPSGLFFATIMITGYHWILCWRICHPLATTWTGFVAIAISVSYFITIPNKESI